MIGNSYDNIILQAARLTPGANIYYADLARWPDWREIAEARQVLSRIARLRLTIFDASE